MLVQVLSSIKLFPYRFPSASSWTTWTSSDPQTLRVFELRCSRFFFLSFFLSRHSVNIIPKISIWRKCSRFFVLFLLLMYSRVTHLPEKKNSHSYSVWKLYTFSVMSCHCFNIRKEKKKAQGILARKICPFKGRRVEREIYRSPIRLSILISGFVPFRYLFTEL